MDQGRPPKSRKPNKWGDDLEVYSVLRSKTKNEWVIRRYNNWFQKMTIDAKNMSKNEFNDKIYEITGYDFLCDWKLAEAFCLDNEWRRQCHSQVRPWTVIAYPKSGGRIWIKVENVNQ